MTPEDILRDLTAREIRFPRAALSAAMEQQEAITPALLDLLAEVTDGAPHFEEDMEYRGHLFALFLLSQFREKRAHPLILRFITWPIELMDSLLGDSITEDLDSWLASTFDGDLEGMMEIARDRDLDSFIRGNVPYALTVLFFEHVLSRESYTNAMQQLFEALDADEDGVWAAELVTAAAYTQLPELVPLIGNAFENDFVDTYLCSLDETEKLLEQDPQEAYQFFHRTHHLIEDTISEMEHWSCFKPKPVPTAPQPVPCTTQPKTVSSPLSHAIFSFLTHKASNATIPKNAPCPCGSGKKYKRCCLNKT